MNHYEDLESQFEMLFPILVKSFSQTEFNVVREFVDANEFGLALETTADIFIEKKYLATQETFQLMQHLAVCMEMDTLFLKGIEHT